jgi:hypothetical protein
MTRWRSDARLTGRLSPDYPDDLQVLAHDGGPRVAAASPEIIWVRITGTRGDAFVGTALNQPNQLKSFQAGDEVLFIVPPNWRFPLLVTEQYLSERPGWRVHACSQCGLSELFDPPSTLIRVVFPAQPADAIMDMFTVRCGACGGAQVVETVKPSG